MIAFVTKDKLPRAVLKNEKQNDSFLSLLTKDECVALFVNSKRDITGLGFIKFKSGTTIKQSMRNRLIPLFVVNYSPTYPGPFLECIY